MGGQVWEVVGGADRGGVLVRSGQDLASPKEPERLSTGALVLEEELHEERLRYRRLTGSGPEEGWVSTFLPGKELLVRTDKAAPAGQPGRAPAARATAGDQAGPVKTATFTGTSTAPAAEPRAAVATAGEAGTAGGAWRLYAISDLHVDYKDNQRWVEQLPLAGHERDAVILAGDISHNVELIRWTLEQFRKRFSHVFFCVGNHELWVTREDARSDGDKVFSDSLEKFDHLMAMARGMGVLTEPAKLGSGKGTLWVLPLQSWYESEFGKPGEELKEQASKLLTDFREVVWPSRVGSICDDAARYFDHMNDALAEKVFADAPVVSFSHFLPRLELMPAELPEDYKLLRAGVGTKRLEDRLRTLGSKLHVFGHSHVNWYTHWNGVHYLQNALRYPQERKKAKSRVDVSFTGMGDPLKPFVIWTSNDSENFCLQPERCGRGCPRALKSSEYYKNKDSAKAATTWQDLDGFAVREGQEADLPQVREHLVAAIDPTSGGDFVPSAWAWWIQNPACQICVIETKPGKARAWGSGLAGMAVLQKMTRLEGWAMALRVRSAARREGVGSLALRALDLRAASWPTGALQLLRMATSSGNEAMLKLAARLRIPEAGRFAFVECKKPPPPSSGHGRSIERLGPEDAWGYISQASEFRSLKGLYQPSIGQFVELTEGRLRAHAKVGEIIGISGGDGSGPLESVAIIVPGQPDANGKRARLICFAAMSTVASLAALLRLAWDYPVRFAEQASTIFGYLPLDVCAPIERGDVPGWSRPRATEEVVFEWAVGQLSRGGGAAEPMSAATAKP